MSVIHPLLCVSHAPNPATILDDWECVCMCVCGKRREREGQREMVHLSWGISPHTIHVNGPNLYGEKSTHRGNLTQVLLCVWGGEGEGQEDEDIHPGGIKVNRKEHTYTGERRR